MAFGNNIDRTCDGIDVERRGRINHGGTINSIETVDRFPRPALILVDVRQEQQQQPPSMLFLFVCVVQSATIAIFAQCSIFFNQSLYQRLFGRMQSIGCPKTSVFDMWSFTFDASGHFVLGRCCFDVVLFFLFISIVTFQCGFSNPPTFKSRFQRVCRG